MRLLEFDEAFATRLVAGADEVGRGAGAGPITAACVVFDLEKDLSSLAELDDSKKITPAKREALKDLILDAAELVKIVSCSAATIDRIGIEQANRQVLTESLEIAPTNAKRLADGYARGLEAEGVIKGDGKSLCIAAASIIAKTTRDHMMRCAARKWPDYSYEKNKGYLTKAHKEGIANVGFSPWTRRSFKTD